MRRGLRSGHTVRLGLVALAAIAAIVVNVVDFPRVEAQTGVSWRALHVLEPDASPLDRVASVGRRYGLFVAVSQAAPRAVVSGACRQHVRSFRQHLFGIGGVVHSERDRRLDSDAILADKDLSAYIVHSQPAAIDAVVAVEEFGARGTHLLVLCPTNDEPADVVIVDAALVMDRLPEGW